MSLPLASEQPGSSALANWQRFEEVGETWQQVRLFVPWQNFSQRVVVRGEAQDGTDDLGHTAIDDFRLTEGSCQNPEGTENFIRLYRCSMMPQTNVFWIINIFT